LWGPAQEEAFAQIKRALVKPTVLASYSLELPTKIRSDASTYGLGGRGEVLLQQHALGVWKPVAYASRVMSETEQQYSQIEKEALGITWACEKFSDCFG
jgi:hypothetical protein